MKTKKNTTKKPKIRNQLKEKKKTAKKTKHMETKKYTTK